MLIGELTQGGIRRAFLEPVDDTFQGVVFRHTQGLEAGVNRLLRGPDGALYVGMIGQGGGGNWHWRQTTFGLQKLVPTDHTPFERHRIEARPDGFEVFFTKPVAADWLADTSNYNVDQYAYEPTPAYGGPKVDEENLEVSKATPSSDGTSVRLVLPGLKEERVVHFLLNPTSTESESIAAAMGQGVSHNADYRPVARRRPTVSKRRRRKRPLVPQAAWDRVVARPACLAS